MAKKITGYIKLQIPAGKANPAPPIGPALGGKNVNIMAFCKEFNGRTQKQVGDILPTIITVYSDKSFTFVTKTPPVSQLLKRAAGIKKGSQTPGTALAGEISKEKIKEVAAAKMKDLNAYDEDQAVLIVSGSARSMGLKIID